MLSYLQFAYLPSLYIHLHPSPLGATQDASMNASVGGRVRWGGVGGSAQFKGWSATGVSLGFCCSWDASRFFTGSPLGPTV